MKYESQGVIIISLLSALQNRNLNVFSMMPFERHNYICIYFVHGNYLSF